MTERLKAVCRQCGLEWDDCLCHSWPLSLFVYSRHQVFCYLCNGDFLPEDGPGTDKIQKSRNTGAPGEELLCVIAEIDARLAMCGEAGEALQDEAPGVLFPRELSRPAMRALNYCSGWRRRRQSYAEWKANQEYARKTIDLSLKIGAQAQT